MPNFSTLSRRRKTLKVNIPCRGSRGPLHLPIDSTGIKVEGEGKWNARRHGGTKPWKPDSPGAIARNEALRASKRFGRTIWRRWSGYHCRSRVETKMQRVKLLGQRLASRDFDRQVAQFQVRVAVLNGFTALGIPVTEVVG